MTEEEWLAASEPMPLLEHLTAKASPRKLRLFTLACIRPVVHRLLWKDVVDIAERYVEGSADEEEYAEAKAFFPPRVEREGEVILHCVIPPQPACQALFETDPWVAATTISGPVAWKAFGDYREHHKADPDYDFVKVAGEQRRLVFAHHSELIRDIFGNPFRPVAFDRAWHTSTVTALAQSVYADRQLPSGLFDTQRLAVLADALEDAGCADADILRHLRGSGEHVRGCWVVDLVLGKE